MPSEAVTQATPPLTVKPAVETKRTNDAVAHTMAELWAMLESTCAGSASAEARLDLFEIVSLDGSRVSVRPRIASQESRVRSLEKWIGDRLTEVIGRPVRVTTEGDSNGRQPAIRDAGPATGAARTAALHADPVVRLALDLFDGRIVNAEGVSGGASTTDDDTENA